MRINVDGQIYDVPDDSTMEEIDSLTKKEEDTTTTKVAKAVNQTVAKGVSKIMEGFSNTPLGIISRGVQNIAPETIGNIQGGLGKAIQAVSNVPFSVAAESMGYGKDVPFGDTAGYLSNMGVNKELSKTIAPIVETAVSVPFGGLMNMTAKGIGKAAYISTLKKLDNAVASEMRGVARKSISDYPKSSEFFYKEKVSDFGKSFDRPQLDVYKKQELTKINKAVESIPFERVPAKKEIGYSFYSKEKESPSISITGKEQDISAPRMSLDNATDRIELTKIKPESKISNKFESDILGKNEGNVSNLYEEYLQDISQDRKSYTEPFNNKPFSSLLKDKEIQIKPTTKKIEYKAAPYTRITPAIEKNLISMPDIVKKASIKPVASITKDIERGIGDPVFKQILDEQVEAAKKLGNLTPVEALKEKRYYSNKASDIYDKRNVKTMPENKQFYANVASGLNDEIKKKLSPDELAIYQQANEKYGMLATLDKIEKAVQKANEGNKLSVNDEALFLIGSKLGYARVGAKTLGIPTFARKAGLFPTGNIADMATKTVQYAPINPYIQRD